MISLRNTGEIQHHIKQEDNQSESSTKTRGVYKQKEEGRYMKEKKEEREEERKLAEPEFPYMVA